MEDHLSISFTNNDNTLLYTEIDKIEYCGYLPENFLPKTPETYSTYKLKIYAKGKATFILEVRREARPPKESNFFSSKPTLEKTLHQLNEIVIIESNIKLRSE